MFQWIGICLGDPTGIGPEITLKTLERELPADDTRYLILGDLPLLQRLARELHLNLPLVPFRDYDRTERVAVLNPLSSPLPNSLPQGGPDAARAAVAWLEEGARRCLSGPLKAILTAPVNKEAIIRAGIPFVGQTEHLSRMAGTARAGMLLMGEDDRGRWLRVLLATTHVPIKDLPAALTREKVEMALEMAALACRQLRLTRARIGVCGLNPHAGEGGKMGTEEITTISPAVNACRAAGMDACGPVAADALFYQAYRGDFDMVVAMYHDQGLAPLKMIGFEKGINWTVGLPFIRTSPDHGTAYNIAGQNKANPSSMIAALHLAKFLAGPG
jgi:4-phospho-D-threonate 3-dehydrogenase / 4-phospho-D-erythronate 3-dehydrogenase